MVERGATPDISLEVAGATSQSPSRPPNIRHLSSPSYDSPLRHHRRQISAPREVKETLHARSEYTNSEDDGAAIHRINQYIIKQEIGRGSFGAVHLAVDQHENEYAVKEFSKSRLRKRAQSHVFRRPGPRPGHLAAGEGGFNAPLHRRQPSEKGKNDNSLHLIREEIAIMKKLNHHNLVQLLEVLDDPSEDSLYMVLEMCKKGVVMKISMGEPADPYDPELCRCWFRDLILGIEYLHAQNIAHRDIKPDNLLLTNDDVLKIVDFGVSEMFEKESDMTTAKSAGSPAFLPPELCVSKHGKISGKASDIWSMGVTLYCLYFGRVPFEKTGVLDLYESIRADPFDLPSDCESDFKDLINRLLEKDPEKRIKMPELREHAWVTRGGLDPLLSSTENTANLVEPPTEEEMNSAITGNLSNLIVVMRAVRKFRGLLARKRPYAMDSILGQSSRMVQPPLSIGEDQLGSKASIAPPLLRHAHSDSVSDRKPIEQNLAREGVHPRVVTYTGQKTASSTGLWTASKSASLNSSAKSGPFGAPSRVDSGKVMDDHDEGKGHAHDPLEEFRYLSIGPGHEEGLPDNDTPILSESPPAAEMDIYETAYEKEVERIRKNSQSATLYLTRRVDKEEIFEKLKGVLGGASQHRAATTSAISEMVDRAKGRGQRAADKAAEGTGELAGIASNLQQKLPLRTQQFLQSKRDR